MRKFFAILAGCVLGTIILARGLENVIYKNTSISEPPGYYLAVPGLAISKGDLVLTCINNNYKQVFIKLGMKEISGECANGLPYLIKRVSAIQGDKVTISNAGVIINGDFQSNSQQYKAGRGIELYPLPVGYTRVLRHDEYFMLGQSPHSVDSRYFGVVPKKDIFRRAILIWRTDN